MFQSSRRSAQALLLAGRPPITGKCHASRCQLLANAAFPTPQDLGLKRTPPFTPLVRAILAEAEMV